MTENHTVTRIARDRYPKHLDAIATLNRVAIEMKIHLMANPPRPAEITPELVEALEEARRDIERCEDYLEVMR